MSAQKKTVVTFRAFHAAACRITVHATLTRRTHEKRSIYILACGGFSRVASFFNPCTCHASRLRERRRGVPRRLSRSRKAAYVVVKNNFYSCVFLLIGCLGSLRSCACPLHTVRTMTIKVQCDIKLKCNRA